VEVTWDEAFAPIEILEGDEAFFEVSDLDAPVEAGQHDTFNVSAMVENTGDFEDTQTVEYEFNVDVDDPPGDDPPGLEDVDVAVVDTDLDTDELASELSERGLSDAEIDQYLDEAQPEQTNDLSGMLASELDDDIYTVHNVSSADLMDHTDHDVYVISQFDTTDINDFLDEISDDTGLVHLDQWSGVQADGVDTPHEELGDPGQFETSFTGDGLDLHINEDHALFEGVGDAGDVITYLDSATSDRAWFGDYSGETLAEISAGGDAPDGDAVGVNDDMNQVLLSSSARTSFTGHDEFTEEEHTLMLNAVEYAAEQALLDGATVSESDDIDMMDGEPIKLAATEDVTLDGGESQEVEFEFEVPGNLREDTYGHGVFSDDDDATDEIYIFEQSPDIKVTGHFLEDDELTVGDELETTAVVTNMGDVTGEREIRLNIDGEIRDTYTIELDPGEVEEVDLSTTMYDEGMFVVSVNGQDPQLVTVDDDEEGYAGAIGRVGAVVG